VTISCENIAFSLSLSIALLHYTLHPYPHAHSLTHTYTHIRSRYVERADTLVILTPSSVHADMINKVTGRKTYTCYRTWRQRGFCVLEFFCANLSRRSTHPVLLVRSELDSPMWISPLESLKLAVGECEFTCCTTNHLGHRGDSVMECSRPSVRRVMGKMIDAKATYVMKTNNLVLGRWILVFKQWWLRGLQNTEVRANINIKAHLQWDDEIDGNFLDRGGVSLLMYAVCSNNLEAATNLIHKINHTFHDNIEERIQHIDSPIPKIGFPHVGILGSVVPLAAAMATSSPKMVQLLLENGANPKSLDINGTNPFMYACASNRVENAKFWLKKFPDWNLEARNTVVGGIALGCAVLMGPNRLKLTELLLKHGASVATLTDTGSSILHTACDSEDSDPEVVRLVLEKQPRFINFRRKSRTLKWKCIRTIALLAVRVQSHPHMLLQDLALTSGVCPIHVAALRGDVEIVELLLSEGADPNIKNDLGQNAAAMCKTFPELHGLLNKRQRQMELRGTQKRTHAVEALGKRISTAIPIQHDMWLISLETMLMLYGERSHGHVMEVHQELKRRGFLMNWRDVPNDSEIIFVSHEWLSWAHPDPEGEQLRVLCHVLERLKKGILDTEMDPLHTMLYKHKFTTTGKDWKRLLKRTYLWVDWFSMPQPSTSHVCFLLLLTLISQTQHSTQVPRRKM